MGGEGVGGWSNWIFLLWIQFRKKIWPLWPWPSTYLKKMFQIALLLLVDNNCAKSFWNPCINVQVMARTSSIYDNFDLYLNPVTLTFNLPEKMFQMALFPPRVQKLCKIILKSMHKCSSFGPDKLNDDHLDFSLTPVTLTFNLPKKMFQMALFLLNGNNSVKLFWNQCIIV